MAVRHRAVSDSGTWKTPKLCFFGGLYIFIVSSLLPSVLSAGSEALIRKARGGKRDALGYAGAGWVAGMALTLPIGEMTEIRIFFAFAWQGRGEKTRGGWGWEGSGGWKRMAEGCNGVIFCMAVVVKTIDPRITAMPGRSTSGFRRPGRHCLLKRVEGNTLGVLGGGRKREGEGRGSAQRENVSIIPCTYTSSFFFNKGTSLYLPYVCSSRGSKTRSPLLLIAAHMFF